MIDDFDLATSRLFVVFSKEIKPGNFRNSALVMKSAYPEYFSLIVAKELGRRLDAVEVK